MYKEFSDTSELSVTKVSDIKSKFEAVFQKLGTLQKAQGTVSRARVYRDERIAIRKMMGCYWGNGSMFSMDLVGAVIRQGSFVEKMHAIDWLHSPALRHTIERLITKYERFIQIMAEYPKETAVPTLDIDLAW